MARSHFQTVIEAPSGVAHLRFWVCMGPPQAVWGRGYALSPRALPAHRKLLLSFELLGEQLVHQLRVGLALRGLHDLADKETHDCFLPRAVLLELLGISGDDFVDDLLQR